MTIEAQQPFDKFDEKEFMRGYNATLPQRLKDFEKAQDTTTDDRDTLNLNFIANVDFIVAEIEKNVQNINQILQAVKNSWRNDVKASPANKNFQMLHILHLEMIIRKLACRILEEKSKKSVPDLGGADTRGIVKEVLKI